MTERIRNTRGDVPATAPTHPDGRPYRFEMIFDGGSLRAYGDEPADLVAELVDGYERLLSPVDRAEARTRYAVGAQIAVQAALVNEHGLDGCSDEERAVLLGSREQQPVLKVWRAPVPLVLVSSFYQPVRHVARPVAQEPGQVWWLDPADDISLLVSLHRLAVIMLHIAAAPTGTPPPGTGEEGA